MGSLLSSSAIPSLCTASELNDAADDDNHGDDEILSHPTTLYDNDDIL